MTFRYLGCWVTKWLCWADTRPLDGTHNRRYALTISTTAKIEASCHGTVASRPTIRQCVNWWKEALPLPSLSSNVLGRRNVQCTSHLIPDCAQAD
jgi:hypothetical protein